MNTNRQASSTARTRPTFSLTYSVLFPRAASTSSQAARWAASGVLRWSEKASRTPAFSNSTPRSSLASITLAASLFGESGSVRTRPSESRYLAYHLAAGLRYFVPSRVIG